MNKYILLLVSLSLVTSTASARTYFNKNKDILVAQFDSKPDPDDIHAQAALGCILAHPDYKNIKYYAVAGAYGNQGGNYIDSTQLFNLAFGAKNQKWTDAHHDHSGSVTRIKNKVKPILNSGGKVWVQEAGQSDITKEWIAALLNDGMSATLIKKNVIVVQHSKWNEDHTSNGVLNYVKSKATYQAIDDGNSSGAGSRGPDTPGYNTRTKSFQTSAYSSKNITARNIWKKADAILKANGHFPSYSAITYGGVDFSDCVENWWILNIPNANSVSKFWNKFVTNSDGSTPDDNTNNDDDDQPAPQPGNSITVYSTADAYVEGSAGKNNTQLKIEANRRVAYLKFNIPTSAKTIKSASLSLKVNGDAGNGTLRFFKGSNNNWSESSINKANAPQENGLIGKITRSFNQGTSFSADLTGISSGNITVIVKMDAGGNDVWFSSKEGPYKPALTITYANSNASSDSTVNNKDNSSDTIDNNNAPATNKEGLAYSYFEGNWAQLPDFSSLTPAATGSVANFDLAPRQTNGRFGFEFKGMLNVPKTGKYTFYSKSNDGSKLFIGDTLVVNNDGQHAAKEKSGTIQLTAGKQPITLQYFNNGGSYILKANWQGPGVSKQKIPNNRLSH